MKIEIASKSDLVQISKLDMHISKEELARLIATERIFVAKEKGKICGWLRFNLFWDNIPFMNLIYVVEEYRNKHLGKELVKTWEVK